MGLGSINMNSFLIWIHVNVDLWSQFALSVDKLLELDLHPD